MGDSYANTDVFYSYYPCTGVDCNDGGFRNRMVVSTNTFNDQLMPAMDYDRYGDVLVSFYDRRDDLNNILYHEYVSKFHADGSDVQDQRVSATASDPSFDPPPPNTVDPHFIGDYQDAWVWTYADGDRLVSAWAAASAGLAGEIHISRTLP